MTETHFLPSDTICANCGLLLVQPPDSSSPGLQHGESTDYGWFCDECVRAGMKMTPAELDAYLEWEAFKEDYPTFAAELTRFRAASASADAYDTGDSDYVGHEGIDEAAWSTVSERSLAGMIAVWKWLVSRVVKGSEAQP